MSSPNLITSFHTLATALQAQMEASRSGMAWGGSNGAGLTGELVPHVESVRFSGLFTNHLEVLDRLIRGEDVPLAEMAAAASQAEYVSNALKTISNGASLQNIAPDQRLRRMTGPVSPSMIPASRRALMVDIEDWGNKVRCPTCYASNPKEVDFCPECGTSLKPELRKVTVLFSDIKGFSAISEGMNPFQLVQLLGEIFGPIGFQIAEQGGRTDKAKLMGDGLMSVFGVPKSQPDHAARAVSAALSIQEKMRALNERRARQGKPPVNIRIGINTGEVVAAYIPFGNEQKYEIIGHAANVASRLEGKADEGGILISEATLAEVGGLFDVEDRGKVSVKNITEPIMTFSVRGKAAADVAIRPRGLMEVELLGRGKELATLQNAFHASLLGTASLTLVDGRPGYGKSRLGAEFIQWLRSNEKASNVTIISGKGIDLPESPPYHVMAQAIKEALMQGAGIKAHDSQEKIEEKLRQHIMYLFGGDEEEASLSAELLAHFIGLPFQEPSVGMEKILKNGRDLRARREEALFKYFDHLSQRQPVVLVCEDLHWADVGTIEIVISLMERLKDKRFLVLGLTRPEFTEQYPEFLNELPIPSHHLELAALHDDVLLQMADQILNGSISSDDKQLIVSQSMGNPFVLQQMARALKEGWKIEKNGTTHSWRFISPSGDLVPPEAQSFFQARVDQLLAEERDLLSVAAVVSREFDLPTVEALGILNPQEVIQSLIAKEFLVGLERGRFEFRHALLRETVERMMDEAKKEELHLASANHYRRSEKQEFEIIAFHYEKGGAIHEAAENYFKGARKAFDEGALKTVSTFEKAFHLGQTDEFRCGVLRSWFEAAFQESNYAEQDKIHEVGSAFLKEDIPAPDRAGVHYRRGRSWNRRGMLEQSVEELLEARRILRDVENTPHMLTFKASINFELGFNYRARGQFEEGYSMMQQAYDVALKTENFFHIGRTLGGITFVANKLGDYRRLHEYHLNGYKACRKARDTRRAVYHLMEWGRTYMLLGDYEAGETVLRRAEKLLQTFGGKAREMAVIFCTLGRMHHLRGHTEKAIKVLSDYLEANPNHNYTLKNLVYLASAYADNNQFVEAEKKVEEIRQRVAKGKPNPEYEAAALTILASIRAKNQDWEGGLEASNAAVRVFEDGMGSDGWSLAPKVVSAEFDLELLATHAMILTHFGRYDEAWEFINIARSRMQKRTATIDDQKHVTSFLTQITTNREVARQWQIIKALREVSVKDRNELNAELRQINFYPNSNLPDEIKAIADLASAKPGEIVRIEEYEIERNDGHHESTTAAAALIAQPLASLLTLLLTNELPLERNPGPIKEFQAEDISFKIIQAQDASRFGVADWKIGSPMASGKIVLLLARRGTKMRELLEADVSERDGSVFINLKRSSRNKIVGKDGTVYEINGRKRPAAGEFGTLRFTFSPTIDNQTIVTLAMGKALYTLNPENFLSVFLNVVKESLAHQVP